MKAARTLQPEDLISHYRIVGPLGAGGMGEVYLAQDQSLERNVALKVLPSDLVQNEERLRRFVLEAKSASSLSHPNIVTIYEIGKDSVHSAAGADSPPVHFISMELVSGKTLSALIHDERVDLRTLLGYLSQAAEGLAKAHAAGIVHRDLKPGNVMVSADGFAKVLDFGLAKLTERRESEPGASSAPTLVAEVTGEGTVLGTAGYMSPEQVQGKGVDHRSDIFSFGCILYEAATRRRPFIADSGVETMHKILHDKPEPVEQVNPKVPAELRRLIRRCLAKSADQRLQSMKDLAIELREIVDEYDSLSASASSGSLVAAAPPPRRTSPRAIAGLVAAGVIVLAGLAWWATHRGAGGGMKPYQTARMSPQTSRGDLTECALSPDGRYLAYIARPSVGRLTLRVRQVATGSDVEVVPPMDGTIEGASFSPDGNYLYYLMRKPDAPNYRTLFQVPSLGGVPRERAFDVDTRATFSPDGKRIAFWRGVPQSRQSALMVTDLDSGQEKRLATVKDPENYNNCPLSWSPDGKQLAGVLFRPSPGLRSTIALFDANTGARRDFRTMKATVYVGLAWLRDGSGLVVCGTDLSSGPSSQVFLLSYPGGRLQPLTNDLTNYQNVSVSSGDEAVAALRNSRLANIWIAEASGGPARQLTRVTNPESSPFGGAPCGNDQLVYSAGREREIQMWSIPASGGEPRTLTSGPQYVTKIASAAGTVICNRLDSSGVFHVWRVNPANGNVRQLTQGSGEDLAAISPDGHLATFTKNDSTRGIWLLDLESGRESLLSATALTSGGEFSPDGRYVATNDYTIGKNGLIHVVAKVLPVTGGDRPVAQYQIPPEADGLVWAPDSKSACFINRSDPARNVYWLPADGDPVRPLTRFTTGRVTGFKWSPDGRRLAVAREIDGVSNVWVTDAAGEHPVQITQLPAGLVFGLDWMPDSRRVIFAAGVPSRDAVLIRQFR